MRRSRPGGEELDLRQLFSILWQGRWIIAGIGFAGTLIALIAVLILPNVYRSEAILAPNQDDGASGLSALATQFGGLAALANFDLGARGSQDKTALGLEILRSRKFISDFIDRHDLLVPVMAAEDWDMATGELIIDGSIYDVDEGEWVRKVRPPKKTVPSLQEASAEFIKNNLYVMQDKNTGFVTVAVEHYSPELSRQWVDWLVRDINAIVMQDEVDEAQQAINYLNSQIAATSFADLKVVFFELIEEQTKTMMLANVTDEYLLKTVDPAVVPERKAKPQRALILIASALASGIVGIVVVLLMSSIFPRRDSAAD
ncbi:MAG: Wzz/FepE/Etk N-terminal domain-containing protein [Gammaproteobacteria bacterium]